MDRRQALALLAAGMALPLGRSEAATANLVDLGTAAASTDPWAATWELASNPPPLSALPEPYVWSAVTRVYQECQYMVPAYYGLNTSFVYALSITTLVQGLVSAANYGYLNTIAHNPPGSDPNDILARQAGICGQAQIVFLEISRWLGVRARPIYIWYPEEFPDYQGPGVPGHAAVEVSYGNTWHYFDPTWGWFFRNTPGRFDKIYSLVEALQLPTTTRQAAAVENRSHLFVQNMLYRGFDATKGTGYWFMDFTHLRVESPFGTVIYSR